MSTGKAHATVTTMLIAPSAIASLVLVPDVSIALAVAVGCATGLIIDPDLDLEDITISEWKMIKRLWIFGMLWVALWFPYAKIIPHRSPLSHFPLLGTLGRVSYLFGCLWLLGAILGTSVPIQAAIQQPLFVAWFAGLAVADTAHFIMDVFSSKIKRVTKRVF